jgi:hypothetical protein
VAMTKSKAIKMILEHKVQGLFNKLQKNLALDSE